MAVRQNARSEAAGSAVTLDATDRRILSALRDDGRLTMAELAAKVGLSQSPCWTRVKRLEATGAIEKYVALLSLKAVGLPNIVFIEVTLDRHDDKVLDQFGRSLAKMAEVIEAYLVTGDYDYLVKVAVSGTEHYERFLRETLYRVPGIRHSRSTFALRALKQMSSVDPMVG